MSVGVEMGGNSGNGGSVAFPSITGNPHDNTALAVWLDSITNLENNEYKYLYWESVSSDSGTVTTPTQGEILLGEIEGLDALVETISSGNPTGNSPTTSGGAPVIVASFDTFGNYTLSGTPSSYPVALLFVFKIKAKYISNVDIDQVIADEQVNVLVGATAGTNGKEGSAPKPLATEQDKILAGSGVWRTIADILGLNTSNLTFLDNVNFVLGTTTGTKIGTATTQKLGFFNATPVVQQIATTDLGTVLSNLGLRASGTAYTITTSGAVSFSGTIGLAGQITVSDGINFALNTTTGTKIGTATTQKLGFFNATPVVQQSATAELGTLLANLGLRASGGNYVITTNGVVTFQNTVNLSAYITTLANSVLSFGNGSQINTGTSTGTTIGAQAGSKLSFWTATPILQPTTASAAATFAANTSGIVNDTATFDGYTLGQVVKILRNLGLLA